MQDTVKLFEQNGYVHLKGFLDEDNCKELTQELNKYIERGETTKDPQCPISEAVHGTPTFDKLLEDLLPHFEKACGKRLYPTYSYARLYKPGEELKNHRDRPACEISATLTLGWSGKQWAIYMGDHEDKSNASEIWMNVGDAVLYRGMENHVTDSFCENLIKTYTQDAIKKEPPVIGSNKGTIDKSIRDTERVLLPQNVGIGATLTATGLNANNYWWQYTITHANQTEFLIYKPDGHYNPHVDTFHQHGSETRKLTALAFLNDDFEGGKFFLNANGTLYYPPQKKGTVLIFPSYMVHGVEPVTKGVRYSCVTWLVGPYFK
jgi:hypothetical protein